MSWEKNWVLAHWRTAAVEKQKLNEKREQVLVDLSVKLDNLFDIPVDVYKFNDSNANEIGLVVDPGNVMVASLNSRVLILLQELEMALFLDCTVDPAAILPSRRRISQRLKRDRH